MSDEMGGEVSGEASEGGEVVEQKQKPAPVPKMRKIKVNGADEYVDEEQVFKDYSKFKGGEAKLKEAAMSRQQTEDLKRRLEEDPEGFFSDPKMSAKKRELAEKWMIEALEEEMKVVDPKDRELEELRKKLKSYDDKVVSDKEDAEKSEHEKFVESRKTSISQKIAEAMKATHLSAYPEGQAALVREIAVYMRAGLERGEEISAEEAVEHLHNTRFNQMYQLAHQYEGNDLIEFLGEEIVGRIRRADLDRLNTKLNGGQPQSYKDEGQSSRPRSNQSFIDPSDERFAMRSGR